MGYRLEWSARPGVWIESCIFESEALALRCSSAWPKGANVRVTVCEDDPGWERANAWFGEPWPYPHLPASVCDDYRLQIATPEHEDCGDCQEPILPNDSGLRMPYMDRNGTRWLYQHAECLLRSVMCPIDLGLVKDPTGTHQHDPDKRRDEARMLMEMSRSRQRI